MTIRAPANALVDQRLCADEVVQALVRPDAAEEEHRPLRPIGAAPRPGCIDRDVRDHVDRGGVPAAALQDCPAGRLRVDDHVVGVTPSEVRHALWGLHRRAVAGMVVEVVDRHHERGVAQQGQREVEPEVPLLQVDHVASQLVDRAQDPPTHGGLAQRLAQAWHGKGGEPDVAADRGPDRGDDAVGQHQRDRRLPAQRVGDRNAHLREVEGQHRHAQARLGRRAHRHGPARRRDERPRPRPPPAAARPAAPARIGSASGRGSATEEASSRETKPRLASASSTSSRQSSIERAVVSRRRSASSGAS